MKKIGPSVGVTGFMSLAEIVTCENTFYEATQAAGEHVAANLKFMVGILVSSKTLAGGTNKYPNRYPPVAHIPQILSLNQPHSLRTIHYNTDDASTIDEQVDQVMGIAPGAIDAIQLNIRWANPVKLQRVRRKYPDLRIILQIGAGALADVTEPEDIYIGSALQVYAGVADDFLVDPSGGKGEPFSPWHVFACLADKDIPANMQPNAAGGRNADNVHEILGLQRRLGRPVGLDAEGRLRTSKEDGDHLHIGETKRYIKAAVPVVSAAMK
ncbi:MAG: hypothetical protein Q8L52_00085 [bacterium]|nr:hypothetical protein [bacterium]